MSHLRLAEAILIGSGFIPMDMVGVQTVFGLMAGAEIHLLWKTRDLVEGFPSWWIEPTTTLSACPSDLDVLAIPMLPPEVQNDPLMESHALNLCRWPSRVRSPTRLRRTKGLRQAIPLPCAPRIGAQ